MAGKSYAKNKGRSNPFKSYVAIPHEFFRVGNYRRCSCRAKAAFLDIYGRFNGSNNGDLSAGFKDMEKLGWKSKQTLRLAIDELLHYGILVMTRRGGRNKTPHLYAVTFQQIHDCDVSYDAGINPSNTALGTWKDESIPDWQEPEWYRKYKNKRTQKKSIRADTTFIGAESAPENHQSRTN